MPGTKLKQFLDENQVRYVSIRHSPAFTAQETAASAHIPGRELAKTVMVKIDGKMAMAVLAAPKRLDLELLRRAAGGKKVSLADEKEFSSVFPDCEPGAMPPLGNLYGLKVYVDESLTEDRQIAFNAGSHAELIQMDYQDFQRLVQPVAANFSARRMSQV
ncbi:MAG: aminoacyl-tRNA deacylase [Planctomycetota bacterium]|jgi:Ala-tRNA(Pro) deacylase